MLEDVMDRSSAWLYTGERQYIEGVPFGGWMNPGDVYTAVTPINEGDYNLLGVIRTAAIADEEFGKHTQQCDDSPCDTCNDWGKVQENTFKLMHEVLAVRGDDEEDLG